MAFNERTSETIAELAGRMMHHPDPDVRRLAASVLTPAPDRTANATGAHAVYKALTGRRSILAERSSSAVASGADSFRR